MATKSNADKGHMFMMEAQKKVSSAGSFFGSLFGGSSKLEDAAELYVRAGNAFKMDKCWSEAGNAFLQSAKLNSNEKMENKHTAGTNYVDSANCFRKCDPNMAVECLVKAVEIFSEMGRFTIAAKHYVTIAEIYETELLDTEKAVAYYEKAADNYESEESKSSANKCFLKVALASAQLEQYEKAIEIFEKIAMHSMDNQLLKYSAKDYFFKAALCHMCVDLLNADIAVKKYVEMFPQFSESREHKLVLKLMKACEEQSEDSYTDAVKDYDSISRLDQWTTTILLRIKKTISGEEDLR